MATFRFNSVEEKKFSFINPNKGISFIYAIPISPKLIKLFQGTEFSITIYKSKYNVTNQNEFLNEFAIRSQYYISSYKMKGSDSGAAIEEVDCQLN